MFLKGLANFYVVLMIIAFLPTPGKDCSPGRLVRCIAIYTIVSIVIFSAVYFWNRIRKGPDNVSGSRCKRDERRRFEYFPVPLLAKHGRLLHLFPLCLRASLSGNVSRKHAQSQRPKHRLLHPCPARGRNRLLCLSKSCRQEKVDPGKVVAASGGHRASRFFGYAGIRRDGRAEIARRKNSPGLIFYS